MAETDSQGNPALSLAVASGVATLTMARPEKKNALTQAMWLELAAMVERLGRSGDVRVLVLTGAGRDFCAGADISEFDTVRRDAATARIYESANSAAFRALREASFPTIAAISGICFGGGFGLAAACDIRIATRDAQFCVPAAKLGLAYPQDAMQDIVNACGPQLARLLTFSAARVDAERAFQAGLLAELVDSGELHKHAGELASAIAANAPLSVRASKAAIAAVLDPTEKRIGHAVELGAVTFDSEDYAEGRAAFRERRPARFAGR